jgi:PEP-CTERM motif
MRREMKKTFQYALAAGTAALGLLAAGGAQANVYNFVVDKCSGGCGASPSTPVGTVVTELESPGVIGITVTLTTGGTFHDSSNKNDHSLSFDLSGSPTITVSDLLAPFTANGSQSASTVAADGLGTFQYAINFPHETHPPVETTFSFDITAPGLTLDSFLSNGTAYFGSDIWAGPGQSGNTGSVGALLTTTVPEPSTWAMLLIGFAGLGFAAFRQGSKTSTAIA